MEFMVKFRFSSLLYFNFFIIIFFLHILQFLVELQFYVITEVATAIVNLSPTALQRQPRFSKIPPAKQEPQPRFSENSQPISSSLHPTNKMPS